MTQGFSIAQQIEEVEREIELRKRVYERIAASKPREKSTLEYHMARMQAVLATLRKLQAGGA
ncbi:MAG: hypothetical protein Q7V31_03650 [Parvibaculum sp.]|uniref:hypothetical protein n=1 Tax=Parvibaculum sp. TaxID=2024848 RepID=UPI0027242913|nr:hypothetical protein [Parvibaculum sp.]MDO8837997.1 hypothetical protein [Parvibaculum sp.]